MVEKWDMVVFVDKVDIAEKGDIVDKMQREHVDGGPTHA